MLRNFCLSLLLPAFVLACASHARGESKIVSLTVHAGDETVNKLALRGAEARHQLLVTAHCADGSMRDVTHEAKFTITPNIAKVNAEGLLIATGNGSASV